MFYMGVCVGSGAVLMKTCANQKPTAEVMHIIQLRENSYKLNVFHIVTILACI